MTKGTSRLYMSQRRHSLRTTSSSGRSVVEIGTIYGRPIELKPGVAVKLPVGFLNINTDQRRGASIGALALEDGPKRSPHIKAIHNTHVRNITKKTQHIGLAVREPNESAPAEQEPAEPAHHKYEDRFNFDGFFEDEFRYGNFITWDERLAYQTYNNYENKELVPWTVKQVDNLWNILCLSRYRSENGGEITQHVEETTTNYKEVNLIGHLDYALSIDSKIAVALGLYRWPYQVGNGLPNIPRKLPVKQMLNIISHQRQKNKEYLDVLRNAVENKRKELGSKEEEGEEGEEGKEGSKNLITKQLLQICLGASEQHDGATNYTNVLDDVYEERIKESDELTRVDIISIWELEPNDMSNYDIMKRYLGEYDQRLRNGIGFGNDLTAYKWSIWEVFFLWELLKQTQVGTENASEFNREDLEKAIEIYPWIGTALGLYNEDDRVDDDKEQLDNIFLSMQHYIERIEHFDALPKFTRSDLIRFLTEQSLVQRIQSYKAVRSKRPKFGDDLTDHK